MRKIIGEAFKAKCAKLLQEPGANIHTVGRKLKCGPSTVYRATGGKRRVLADASEWVETTRKARTKTGRANGVGAATKENARRATSAVKRAARVRAKAARAAAKKPRGGPWKRQLKPRAA